jgi:Pyruvate phosphate dikinase, AMP/ATP-binding domain
MMRLVLTLLLVLLACSAAASAAEPAGAHVDASKYRAWIFEMKTSPRGPFASIRWFCKDGRVLQPQDYACAQKGQGWQHGDWSDRTRQIRAAGYRIATPLAGVDADKLIAGSDFDDLYAQLLVERFLVAADDGWILRQARFYRGAIQEEDERDGARQLLTAMAARPEWAGRRFLALYTGVKLLPHGTDSPSALRVRNQAATLADKDPAFAPLRVKIHGSPDASDAAAVRAYAAHQSDGALRAQATALAADIERLFAPQPLAELIESSARAFDAAPALQAALRSSRDLLHKDSGPGARYLATSGLLADMREALPSLNGGALRLRALDLSAALEAEHFRAAVELRTVPAKISRADQLALLDAAADAIYGTGLINGRERAELRAAFRRLSIDRIELDNYVQELRYLGLVSGWATQQLQLQFGEVMAKLSEIEPLADLFIQDQLRGSALLFFSNVLDALARDANRVAGVQHKVLGRDIGTGLNALNPGLARGTLRVPPDMKRAADFSADGIYVLSETVAELPPVAGILTTGAGNPLSHVQLLARNLGIPNVAIDESLLPTLRASDGQNIVLAVSPGGLVEIASDGPKWDAAFGTAKRDADVIFEPDIAKLDLTQRDFVSLDALRAHDSGRIVGPKAAKLGELKARFRERFAPGVAIPFGLYREAVLDRPYRATGKTVYQWMVESFRALEALPQGSREAAQASEKLRAEIYAIVANTDPGPRFRERLKAAMAKEFGADFRGGVFVRSDTNVEDLPGFTGAGLNLTLFNLAGLDNIVKGISQVWASPYTQRAWAWRQAHMKGPEHVYPAVLLLQTVPADTSGVMITQDVTSGDPGVLSVAVNEGVGGAVDGQAAESVRIDRATGNVRLMASATAPRRLVPLATGGVARRPTSSSETLLRTDEVRQLIALADEIPRRFPQLGEDGKPVAADVEFAFVAGQLWLLQIRPFNESNVARSATYLRQMDRALDANRKRVVDLREVPR